MTAVEVFAPAKINLTLHVVGQRPDGYHLLDSLVAFAGIGDRLTLAEADVPSFSVTGPFAAAVPQGDDNLVLRAARLVPHHRPVAITLDKRLPPASGIGGGSADAAAAFRGMLSLAIAQDGVSGMASADPPGDAVLGAHGRALLALGADIPMCLISRPLRATGVGEDIELLEGIPSLHAVLVNPKRALPTPEVFAALVRRDNPPMPDEMPSFPDAGCLADWLSGQRNDLQEAAERIVPQIADVVRALSSSEGALLARMSGSGATCFGIFRDKEAATAAARALAAEHPDWWIKSAIIGGQGERALPQRV
jgi:4-diphosphocytidyl-2-C-methyl-D-erythritol kinase